MKKITLLLTVLFTIALCASAQINNPKDADGYYIVKWDCANDTWATSNDIEIDETFTFAVDITGTALEEWVKGTPTTDGGTRGIAINRWTGFGDLKPESNRMKPITGDIYGATWNMVQLANTLNVEEATEIGVEAYVTGAIFGFEYTATNAGAQWWIDPIDLDPFAEDGQQPFFKTLPYTGTKTGGEFYNDDYPGLFEQDFKIAGYAPACASIVTGLKEVQFDAADVVATEFYTLQGVKLNTEPQQGLYIKTYILSNGSRVSEKTINNQK